MKKVVLSVVAALAVSAAPAVAADMPVKGAKVPVAAPAPASPFDIAFGGAIMSDYNFRGVSQSNRGPSGGAYVEPQLTVPFGTLYVGLAAWAIDWPTSLGFTAPSAEVDLYGGWRNSWGPFSADLGFIYYYYPRETFNGATGQSDFYELYGKLSYAVTPAVTVGANGFYTPDLLHYSTSFAAAGVNQKADAFYGSLTGKWVLPWTAGALGAYVSTEVGHWWIDSSGFTATGFTDPSYTYGNIGLAFTYKVLTLDLRYHATDMSRGDCGSFLLVAAGNAATRWCGNTFIASLKFDTALSALK
jgi:uncharacterized protein (TIGR02001 family)